MKKIGLTQRVYTVEAYQEDRDTLDQRWAQLLFELDYIPIPLSNTSSDHVEYYIEALNLDGVIFTGGNDLSSLADGSNKSPLRDQFETALLKLCLKKKLPVLGVCRGMQLINTSFSGSLSKIEEHVAKSHELSSLIQESVFAPFNGKEVNSYHNYAVSLKDLGKDLSAELKCLKDDSIEAFSHKQHPVFAMMWHPERNNPFLKEDKEFIRNIFN